VTSGQRVFLDGRYLELALKEVQATAILLKVDSVHNFEHRRSAALNHLPDSTNSLLTEIQVFSAPVSLEPAMPVADLDGFAPLPQASPQPVNLVEEGTIPGFDPFRTLASFQDGSWVGHNDGASYEACDNVGYWAPQDSAGSEDDTRILNQGHREQLQTLCQGMKGSEVLLIGDSRMRHLFLTFMASFKPEGSIPGFVHVYRSAKHGGFHPRKSGRPPETGEDRNESADWSDQEELELPGLNCSSRRLFEGFVENGPSQGLNGLNWSDPVHTEMLCAGAMPVVQFEEPGDAGPLGDSQLPRHTGFLGFRAPVCGGRVKLTYVGANSSAAFEPRIRKILKARGVCEADAGCESDTLLLLTSLPFEAAELHDFRTARVVSIPPAEEAISFARLMAAAQQEYINVNRWNLQRRTLLIYINSEPAVPTLADSAPQNVAIVERNTAIESILKSANIPWLDSFSLAIARVGCGMEKIFWKGPIQRAKMSAMMHLAKQLASHARNQVPHDRMRSSSFRDIRRAAALKLRHSEFLASLNTR